MKDEKIPPLMWRIFNNEYVIRRRTRARAQPDNLTFGLGAKIAGG
jgi:hypothetical protein